MAFVAIQHRAPQVLASQVSIVTINGRVLSGAIDARTDQQALWVRSTEPNVVLSVPVFWTDIASAQLDDQHIEVAELRNRYDELVTNGPASLFDVAFTPSSNTVVEQFPLAASVARIAPRVRNLEVLSAVVVNFDRDPAPDGLTIAIAAISIDGVSIPVEGNIRAELHGERRSTGDANPRFEVLDRWTKPVHAADFIDGVATYCLPFRRTWPEWEVDIAPDAEILVRLGAGGHGNYAAAAPVLLRNFAPYRDDLQQHRGSRFLPNETYHRPLNPFGHRAGLWQWWPR